jgi:hypothetical protein
VHIKSGDYIANSIESLALSTHPISLQTTRCQNSLDLTLRPINIPIINQISLPNLRPHNRRLRMVNIRLREDRRLARAPEKLNEDLLLCPCILDMQDLRTIRVREGGRSHSIRESASRVEAKVGAAVVAVLPGQVEGLEESAEDIHGGEVWEVAADDQETAVVDVGKDFLEDGGDWGK